MSGRVETTVKGFNEAMYTGGQKALLEGMMRLPSEEPSARSGLLPYKLLPRRLPLLLVACQSYMVRHYLLKILHASFSGHRETNWNWAGNSLLEGQKDCAGCLEKIGGKKSYLFIDCQYVNVPVAAGTRAAWLQCVQALGLRTIPEEHLSHPTIRLRKHCNKKWFFYHLNQRTTWFLQQQNTVEVILWQSLA